MEEYFDDLQNSAIFQGFSRDEMLQALKCLDGKIQGYQKKAFVFHMQDTFSTIGMVLSGSVLLTHTNYQGQQHLMARRQVGELVGEHFLWEQNPYMNFDVVAGEDSLILFIEKDKIVNRTRTTCHLRQRIIENLFRLLLSSNQNFYQKMDMMTQKSLRERIMYYLELQKQKNNQNAFTIPFSRNELAEYLSVERSALSRELSKMQKEGLIQYKGRFFKIQ